MQTAISRLRWSADGWILNGVVEVEKTNTKRRNFMLALGLGGMGAAVGLKGNKLVESKVVETVAEAPGAATGYRLSAHVQTYYRKASI